MELLQEIDDKDIGGTTDFSVKFLLKKAVCLVVTKDNDKVAMLYSEDGEHHYLPGGDMELWKNTDFVTEREVGVINEYRKKTEEIWISYCFERVIKKEKLNNKVECKRYSLDEAITVIKQDKPKTYAGKFIQKKCLRVLSEVYERRWLDATIKLYNKGSKKYKKTLEGKGFQEYYDIFTTHLSGKKILDIGCGSGRDLKAFLDMGYDAYGIDVSQGLLDVASEEVPTERLAVADMTKLALHYGSDTFDGIWSFASIVHMSKHLGIKTLKQAYTILKDGGIICVSVKFRKEGEPEEVVKESFTIPGTEKRYVYYGKDEILNILKTIGFSIITTNQNTQFGGIGNDDRVVVYAKK